MGAHLYVCGGLVVPAGREKITTLASASLNDPRASFKAPRAGRCGLITSASSSCSHGFPALKNYARLRLQFAADQPVSLPAIENFTYLPLWERHKCRVMHDCPSRQSEYLFYYLLVYSHHWNRFNSSRACFLFVSGRLSVIVFVVRGVR